MSAGLHTHEATGLLVDAERGSIYPPDGPPFPRKSIGGRRVIVLRHRRYVSRIPCARIVWEAVHGPVPAGTFVDFAPGRPRFVRLANLRLVEVGDDARPVP